VLFPQRFLEKTVGSAKLNVKEKVIKGENKPFLVCLLKLQETLGFRVYMPRCQIGLQQSCALYKETGKRGKGQNGEAD
jgi:hypothetical protein